MNRTCPDIDSRKSESALLPERVGTVYWITGLPGAGKTTLANALVATLKESNSTVIHLDGDVLRDVYGEHNTYEPHHRKSIAFRNARLCQLISSQGIDVVCSTVSMFHEVREWNRSNLSKYKEIYLKVPMDVLIDRDQKGLFSSSKNGDRQHLPGIDYEIEEPEAPDFVFCTDGTKPPIYHVNKILSLELE